LISNGKKRVSLPGHFNQCQLPTTARVAARVAAGDFIQYMFLFATQLAQQAKTGELDGDELLLQAHQKLLEIEHAIPVFNAMKDAATVIAQSKQAGMDRIERYVDLQHGNECRAAG